MPIVLLINLEYDPDHGGLEIERKSEIRIY